MKKVESKLKQLLEENPQYEIDDLCLRLNENHLPIDIIIEETGEILYSFNKESEEITINQ